MKYKKVKLSLVTLLFVSLMLINYSIFTPYLDKQKITSIREEFLVHAAQDPNTFISIWDTRNISPASSGSNQIRLPLESNGTYDFIVDWGDNTNDTITIWNQTQRTHNYASEGIYTINISGTITGWKFNNGGDRLKIIEIQQWGCLQLGNSGSYFSGCANLVLTATDNLNLTGTTNLNRAFYICRKLGSGNNMNGWNVSSVTTMYRMFSYANDFDQPIDHWDVSSVINMSEMFYNAFYFNQPINSWDVSHVLDMSGMFYYALSFNQPIGSWDVSNVKDMSSMFYRAESFNQYLDNWDVSNVENMMQMFLGAIAFNQPIGSWDVSNVVTMFSMFNQADSFNQSIGDWDVSNVRDMSTMFAGVDSFDQPLGSWNVSSVTSMDFMFAGATLSTSNYDNLLLGWSQLSLQTGVNFDAGYSKYSDVAADARQSIISTFSWTIKDGGLATEPPSVPGYNLMVFIVLLGAVIAFVVKRKKLVNTKISS